MHLQTLLCLSSSTQKFSQRYNLKNLFYKPRRQEKEITLAFVWSAQRCFPAPSYHPFSLFCSHPFTLAYQWSLVLTTAMIWVGQEETRCYSIIPNTLEKSIFCPQPLQGKSTPVALSAKMRRHTACCFTHLLHCTILCIPLGLSGFSNPTKLTVTWFKSQPTILMVPPFTLKIKFPLLVFLLPDQNFHPWPLIFRTQKCYRLRSSSLCQLRSRNGW